MKLITEAILQVMDKVSYLKNDKTVGYGHSSYKAISDKKVKEVLRPAMISAGLFIAPVDIEYDSNVERWTHDGKQKQQVMLTATITYLVQHISGESMQIKSFGVGIDAQDKSAGKAMTYAQKYAMLNLFSIPTGDDPDNVHSSGAPIPKAKPTLTRDHPQYNRVVERLKSEEIDVEKVKEFFEISESLLGFLENL